jgi:hypothetical protein
VSAVVPVRVIAAAGDERATGAVRTRRVVARLLLPLVADRAEVGIVSVAVQTIAEAVRAHIGGHPDDSRPRSSCVSHIQYGTAGSSGVRICVDHSLVR